MPAGSGDRWAEDYERGRPGWPAEAVELPGETVLEIAAGTGKLTRLLVERFPGVVAVEPADAMRAHNPDAVSGTAHDLPLPDDAVDAVFVGEAFHKATGVVRSKGRRSARSRRPGSRTRRRSAATGWSPSSPPWAGWRTCPTTRGFPCWRKCDPSCPTTSPGASG